MKKSKPLMQVFNDAVALSKGYAIGPLRFLSTVDRLLAANMPDSDDIKQKVSQAFQTIKTDLETALDNVEKKSEQFEFLNIQLMILTSFETKLLNRKLLKDNESINKNNTHYQDLKSYYKSLLGNSMMDNTRPVILRVMSALSDIPFDDLSDIKKGDIVFATALTLKQASDLIDKGVGGLITCDDPADGHLRAMALQHGIPCITGISKDDFIREENDDHTAIIDAENGGLIIDPDSNITKQYRDLIKARKEHREQQRANAVTPCETKDGHYISLLLNVNDLNFDNVAKIPFDGVGLVRLEMIFMHHAAPIGSTDQTRMFEKAFVKLGSDRPITVRALDVNKTDKHPDIILHGPQRASVIGAGTLEGMEFLLANPALLQTQMRSLIRTSIRHPVEVLLPAVRSLKQITEARRMFKGVYEDILQEEDAPLGLGLPPLGIMIETEDIVKSPRTLRKAITQIDFVSVGTNDLTHELARTDRYGKPCLKSQDIQFNPRFIKALKHTSDICLEEEKDISMCGNLASDLEFLPLVLALRMKPVVLTEQIYDVRERISLLNLKECDALLERVSKMTTTQEIKTEVKKFSEAALKKENRHRPIIAPA